MAPDVSCSLRSQPRDTSSIATERSSFGEGSVEVMPMSFVSFRHQHTDEGNRGLFHARRLANVARGGKVCLRTTTDRHDVGKCVAVFRRAPQRVFPKLMCCQRSVRSGMAAPLASLRFTRLEISYHRDIELSSPAYGKNVIDLFEISLGCYLATPVPAIADALIARTFSVSATAESR